MNIPLLTTPSFRSPHVVVVWECKNSFFCIPNTTPANFFLFFLHFFAISLYINKIKVHFSCFWPLGTPLFCLFLALFGSSRRRNFADFRKISAKIEFQQPPKLSNFGVIIYMLLIYCIIHILVLCILLYFRYLYIIIVLFWNLTPFTNNIYTI